MPAAALLRARGPAGRAALRRCLEGEISAPIALLHLVGEFDDAAALTGFLDESPRRLGAREPRAVARLDALRAFARDHLDGQSVVRRMGVCHAQATSEVSAHGVRAIRDLYDRLVEIDPNTAVALYAFGDPEVLRAASAEVVDHLTRCGLLSPKTRLLELGCGIGRLIEACAHRCGSLTGIDVSPRMVELAAARVKDLANVRVQLCNGSDLEGLASQSMDVVLAADSWPHVLMLGAEAVWRLTREVARVLVPGGEFVVLNFSYREDRGSDVTEVRELASAFGFAVVEEASRPFALWDAAAWRLRRAIG